MGKTPTTPSQMRLNEAIKQLREELRTAGRDRESAQDIVFTVDKVELELGVTFGLEAEAGVGFKLLARRVGQGQGIGAERAQDQVHIRHHRCGGQKAESQRQKAGGMRGVRVSADVAGSQSLQ